MDPADLVLLPWVEARAALAGRNLTFRLVAPPYAAAGRGALRVLLIRERAGGYLDVVCGYDGYIRI